MELNAATLSMPRCTQIILNFQYVYCTLLVPFHHIVDRWLDGSEGFIGRAFIEIGICSFCKVSINYSSLLIFARSMHLFKLSHDGNNLKFESVYGFMI